METQQRWLEGGIGTQLGFPHSPFMSGSQFKGYQQSKGNKYHVEVIVQYIDHDNDLLSGYLKIQGLTEEFPTLTTFFEGEIIGKKHSFLTRKWDASEEVDRKHWGKFPSFQQFSKSFNSDSFDYKSLNSCNCIFMRWKELFLVPDHRITDINGASLAGFYYICLHLSSGTIDGFYYHRLSDWYGDCVTWP
jgi:hypothetical protein